MARFVRQSSYRHVFGTPAKEHFANVKGNLAGEGYGLAANGKFFVFPQAGGGGPVHLQPLSITGRTDKKTIIAVHKNAVLDVQFSPFADNVYASSDDVGFVKVVTFPTEGHPFGEELTADSAGVSVTTLEGHSKRVNMLAFHPTTDGVLASCSDDGSAIVWNVATGDACLKLESDDAYRHVTWNTNGSLLGLTLKSGKAQIVDPRDSKTSQFLNTGFSNKKSSILFADNHELIITAGSKGSNRSVQFWDPKKLDVPVLTSDIDTSPGILLPYYDADNSILWITGKGDGTIKYFELVKEAGKVSLPALSEFRDGASHKTGCFVPKRFLETKTCEIARFLRVMGETIVPVHFSVPRKSDLFQKDLYPDTYAGISSQSAADYFAGKNAEPKLVSMKPGAGAGASSSAAAVASTHKSSSEYEAEIATLKAKVAELEARLAGH